VLQPTQTIQHLTQTRGGVRGAREEGEGVRGLWLSGGGLIGVGVGVGVVTLFSSASSLRAVRAASLWSFRTIFNAT
jgi:hypothetical protein